MQRNRLWENGLVAKAVGFALLLGCAIAPLRAQQAEKALQTDINTLAAAHQGKIAVYAKQLNTGKEVSLLPDELVQTASVIKLGILYEAMVEVREGKAKWDEPITMPADYAVGGSGMLQFFDAPMQLTLKDMLSMMVIVSDNTATDLAIDRFTVKTVDDRLAQLGLKNTYLYKRISKPAIGTMPDDQPKFGLGKTTAREMAMLMETIGRCELHPEGTAAGPGEEKFGPVDDQDRAVCKVALHMLTSQFYRDTIPRYLDPVDSSAHGSAIASKTGSLNQVRNDVALVAGKSGPMVISIFTWENKDQSWTVDNEGEMTIAKIARAIQQAWSPAGIDNKTLVPGLGLEEAKAAK
jgi:beta-lactamase class A